MKTKDLQKRANICKQQTWFSILRSLNKVHQLFQDIAHLGACGSDGASLGVSSATKSLARTLAGGKEALRLVAAKVQIPSCFSGAAAGTWQHGTFRKS